MCEEEGLGPRNRDAYALVESAVPALIVNGAWDPVTPPALARAIVPGFSNGRYIEVPYAGHGPTRSMSECAGGVLTAFFDNPDPAALDASCLEEGVERPDYLDLFQTTAIRRAGILAADDPKTLAAPGAWAGASLLVLVFAFFAYPMAWLARAIDRRRTFAAGGQAAGVRGFGWLAALSGLGFAGLMGFAGYQASEVSTFALLTGLAPMASMASWLSLLAGLFGLAALFQVWRARSSRDGVQVGTLAGGTLTGLAALSLAVFAFAWDLAPL